MGLIGLVMAGGRSVRLGLDEKPLVPVGGIPMIKRVVTALQGATSVSAVFVAVSRHTPRTKAYAASLGGVGVVETPGEGYHSDLKFAIKRLGRGPFFVVPADLPLLSSEIVERVIAAYQVERSPALTTLAPLELFEALRLNPTSIIEVGGKRLVPCGINIIDGSMIDEPYIKEKVYLLDDPRACLNVNTIEDLERAKNFLRMDKPS